MSRVEGVQGFLRGSWLQRSIMSKFLRVSKVLGRQVSKVEGDPGLIMRFKAVRKSLKVDGFNNFLIQGVQGSEGQRVSRHVGIYL